MAIFHRDVIYMMEQAYRYKSWWWDDKAHALMDAACLEYIKQEEEGALNAPTQRTFNGDGGIGVTEIEEPETSTQQGQGEGPPGHQPWHFWG